MLGFRTIFKAQATIKTIQLFSISMRYFPRKVRTSTIYEANPLQEKKLNPVRPDKYEKERGVYSDETRQKGLDTLIFMSY